MSRAISFRDPSGFCISLGERFLRAVAEDKVAEVETFLVSRFGKSLLESGRLIPTRLLAKTEVADCLADSDFQQCLHGRRVGAVFEHERIEFPSFPYEWPPEMLYAGGRLTLEVAQEALEADYTLKDATPYNILFRGPKPIFVDLLSFEPRQHGECIWRPYAQFVRTFLLPLLANKYFGRSLADVFLTHRDGLEPEEVYRSCRGIRKLLPPFLSYVSLPTWLSGKARKSQVYNQPPLANDEKARFIVQTLLKRLERGFEKLRPTSRKSTWSDYTACNSYDSAAS